MNTNPKKIFIMMIGEVGSGKTTLVNALTDPASNYIVEGHPFKDAIVLRPENLFSGRISFQSAMVSLLAQIRIWLNSDSDILIIDHSNLEHKVRQKVLDELRAYDREKLVGIATVAVIMSKPDCVEDNFKETYTLDIDKEQFTCNVWISDWKIQKADVQCEKFVDIINFALENLTNALSAP